MTPSTRQKPLTIGIMAAMEEEIATLKNKLDQITSETIGGREYTKGKFHGTEVILVFSRWGKVAAASTATTLITKYHINNLIFTGAAGAVSNQLTIGDIIIGNELYQHDMNAEPIFKKHEIPLTGITYFESNPLLVEHAFRAAHIFTKTQKILIGKIASGDQFINTLEKTDQIKKSSPDTLAVEMEGAAVAQVCHEHNIPFVIIRIISDNADHSASIDFPKFIQETMAVYSEGILSEMVKLMKRPATNICEECKSLYFAEISPMAALCPECSHRLYGYKNCRHVFKNGRCSHCHWDGSVSEYCQLITEK